MSAAWISSSTLPVCADGHGIQVIAVIVGFPDEDEPPFIELAHWWPLERKWTVTFAVGNCTDDIEVRVSHYMALPEMPA